MQQKVRIELGAAKQVKDNIYQLLGVHPMQSADHRNSICMLLQRPWLQFRKQERNCCPDLVVAVVGSYAEIYAVVYVWKSGAFYGEVHFFCGKICYNYGSEQLNLAAAE
jgi:hypothetical protein